MRKLTFFWDVQISIRLFWAFVHETLHRSVCFIGVNDDYDDSLLTVLIGYDEPHVTLVGCYAS